MASYLVTGASRGLGFEFLRQLSNDPANTVIGLVRNKEATEKKVSPLSRTNIHILQGDITDYESLKKAAHDMTRITGGRLDYLIANAAIVSRWSAYDPIGVLGEDPSALELDLLDAFRTNVIANIHLFNLFMPLVKNGHKKKVITISSGMADIDAISKFNVDLAAPYSISKAGMNAAVAKFSAQYAKDGVLFMSISPGLVETGQYDDATEEQKMKAMALFGKFQSYVPNFTGPNTPESAVKDVISVIENASVARGDGGSFVSHFGNKQWL